MGFPVTEVLQVLIGLCVVLAAGVLLREVISLGRKSWAKAKPVAQKEDLTSLPGLSDLESEMK